jgi:ferric-dicitrate binding protein FerR (iron transport regulator)
MNNVSAQILKLISSYTAKEISQTEFNELRQWLKEAPENKQLFSDYLQFYKKSRQISFLQFMDKDKAWYKIVSQLENPLVTISKQKKSKVVPIRKPWFKYAAAILVIALVSTYFLRDTIFNNHIENTTPIIVNNQIEKGTDKATLTLEDGSTVILEKGSTYQAKNANSNGEQIIYQPTTNNQQLTTDNRQLITNTLTIPRGGEFFVQLSDGTKVWLNSESQLKYPVAFIEGKTRQVEIVYGEAYFEVSPSTEHKGSNFKVLNKAQEIEVLGTEFNIKAYKDETHVYTTLATGKVKVNYNGQSKNLIPGQQFNLDAKTNTHSVYEVDVKSQTAWKEGIFDFEGMQLKEIMKVLSRWYDFEVIFENKSLETVKFKGILSKNQRIEEILSAIRSTSLNNYEINDKTIILK